MDGSEFQAARKAEDRPEEDLPPQEGSAEAHDAAYRAALELRGQIAALRQQVKDAQDTLRDHKRRQETRTFEG
jgi:hypothetical protein